MMMADLLITGGILVSPDGEVAADLVVRDGRIEDILAAGSESAAREVIEADGLHVLPGAIDVHTHVRDPGDAECRHAVGAGDGWIGSQRQPIDA